VQLQTLPLGKWPTSTIGKLIVIGQHGPTRINNGTGTITANVKILLGSGIGHPAMMIGRQPMPMTTGDITAAMPHLGAMPKQHPAIPNLIGVILGALAGAHRLRREPEMCNVSLLPRRECVWFQHNRLLLLCGVRLLALVVAWPLLGLVPQPGRTVKHVELCKNMNKSPSHWNVHLGYLLPEGR